MKKQQDIAIRLTGISKKYEIHHEKPTLVEKFVKRRNESFWALKNINLTIRKGEQVGIIGPNGSGKTTLLKVISRITTPTSGMVTTNGKLVSLIDLEAGFHPDLTGKENIIINGQLIGMTRKKIKENYHNIVDFSGINTFIHAPFFTYSSGMKFRLAFSLAMASECDILVIDEVFLVGDFDFQNKSVTLLKSFQKKHQATLIVASHAPIFLWNFAESFYSMEKGILLKQTKQQVKREIEQKHRVWRNTFRVSGFDS